MRRVSSGDERLTLRCTENQGRTRVIASIAATLPAAVLVQVPRAVDQTERVILELATALGDDVVQDVDHLLRAEPEVPRGTLDALGEALGGRMLVVDGWDRLGSPGSDQELGSALQERCRALRAWLGDRANLLAVSLGPRPRDTHEERWQSEAAPVSLHNGAQMPTDLWAQFQPDAQSYELALALTALCDQAPGPLIEGLDPAGLRAAVVERLPDSQRTLLRMLAVHGRPLHRSKLEGAQGIDARAVEEGRRLGLFHDTPAGLMTDEGWWSWWSWTLAKDRQRVHLELAELFGREARPTDREAGRAGLALLEAHRHYLAAGDVERARSYARYGAGLLADAARNRSLDRDYVGAAGLYEIVVRFAEEQQLPIGAKLRAYARHYLHFNRARAQMEEYRETESGYRAALEDWPENALFWSRLVRVLFYRNRPAGALEELHLAMKKHPQKGTVLYARTVRGLLKHERILDSVLAWDHFEADTMQASEVERWLALELARGWRAAHLSLDTEAPLFFSRPQEVRLERIPGGWLGLMPALDVDATGDYPVDALRNLVARLRDEARRMIHALTGTLDAETRLRKQRILAAVDVAASRVDAAAPEATWVFGDLERDDEGRVWLVAGGSCRSRFEVPEDLADGQIVDAFPHFALVKTGASGVPAGPIMKLEPGCRRPEDELWEEWRRRFPCGAV